MKKYKDRFLRGVSKVIGIVYLSSTILWGGSCCAFSADRAQAREDFDDGKISHEVYLLKCQEMSEREESVLKTIAIVFGSSFVVDVTIGIVESERE